MNIVISKCFLMVICFLIKVGIYVGYIYSQFCSHRFVSALFHPPETWPSFLFLQSFQFTFSSSSCQACQLVDRSKFLHLQCFFSFLNFSYPFIILGQLPFPPSFEILFNILTILDVERPLKVTYFVRSVLGCK